MARSKILQSENSRTRLTLSESPPRKFTQFLASLLATLSALCLGMCLTWTSPALPMLNQPDSPLKITEKQGAWVGSLLTLGAFVGAIPAGSLANWMGRKRTLQLLALPIFASWMMIAFGGTVEVLYLARFLAGLAGGGISVAAPMYVGELAHTSIRGTLGTFFQGQITVGVLLAYLLGAATTSFRFLALASSAFPLVFLVVFSFMPESPVYLYKQGRTGAARKSLVYFRGPDYTIENELMKIAEDIEEATKNAAKLSDLVRCRATLAGLVVALGLMAFQQLSGINAVLFYTGHIFSAAGSSLPPTVCAILVGLVQVIATPLATLLIDKAGRKILLFISSSVMCLCLIALGIYFHLKETQDVSHLNSLPLVSMILFVFIFSIGLGPIPWIILGEVFTARTKGIASSVAASSGWIFAFAVTNRFQKMTECFGTGATFFIFAAFCGVGVLFITFLVPETKGRDVDQVQIILLGNKFLNWRCLRRRSLSII